MYVVNSFRQRSECLDITDLCALSAVLIGLGLYITMQKHVDCKYEWTNNRALRDTSRNVKCKIKSSVLGDNPCGVCF